MIYRLCHEYAYASETKNCKTALLKVFSHDDGIKASLTSISVVLERAVKRKLRSRRDWVRYLLSPTLCFIERCYDKEEFDTDRSKGFLKRLNRILCSVIIKT